MIYAVLEAVLADFFLPKAAFLFVHNSRQYQGQCDYHWVCLLLLEILIKKDSLYSANLFAFR